MDLPRVRALYDEAMERLKDMQDGKSRQGFGALVDAARYTAIAEVCQAIRADLASLPHNKDSQE